MNASFFFRHIFSAHFVRFLFSFFHLFLLFSVLFHEKEGLHCANAQASIFYGLLAIQSQKLLNY